VARTIPAALASAARRFGDAEALAEPGGERLSWNDLHEQAGAVARALTASGVEPGDRVASWLPNGRHWVLAALGALTAGATLVPVSTRFTGYEALDIISRSGAKTLFVAEDFLGTDRLATLRAAAAETGTKLKISVVRVPGDWAEFLAKADNTATPAVGPGDISDIMFTSGTTGRSKGAGQCHRRRQPGQVPRPVEDERHAEDVRGQSPAVGGPLDGL
jgi:acyl-CoA synthetase (AMP-forming)/AMP-acid ligase II